MNNQTLSEEARSFSWLLNGFVEKTAGVTDAVAVSSDDQSDCRPPSTARTTNWLKSPCRRK